MQSNSEQLYDFMENIVDTYEIGLNNMDVLKMACLNADANKLGADSAKQAIQALNNAVLSYNKLKTVIDTE